MGATGAKTRQVDRRIQILIADDYPAIRQIVRSTLDQHPAFEVCGEVENGADAVKEARKLRPDVVVLNVCMPVLNGFDAAREIRASLPETAIVILSSNADQHFIEEAKKIGVQAYVAKMQIGEALIRAINQAVQGSEFVLVK